MDSLFSACWAIESDGRELEPSDEPLWVLGVLYDIRTELEAARNDIMSRVWLTYRRGFPALSDGSTTTDRGWGCMLRCGQMLLAEAGIRRHLGRAWRWSSDCRDPLYLKLVSMFQDQPLAPFSLHVMTSLGQHTGKSIGEWYGPNTVAHLIRRLPEFDVWNNFVVAVVTDHILIVDETRELSKKSHPNGWDPLLILIPLRLGVDHFNPTYIEPLQKFFQMPQSLGILGGTPSHALFLIGYVGNDVIFLDPHTTQDSASVDLKEVEEQVQADCSYHCRTTPHMPFNRLDPSMALCFLCNNEAEFTDLIARLRANLTIEGAAAAATVLLEVMNTRPDFMKDALEEDSEHDSSRLASSFIVLSDVSDNMVQGKDGDCLEDSRRSCVLNVSPDRSSGYLGRDCKPIVSPESSQLDYSDKTVTEVDKSPPHKWRIAGEDRNNLRTAQMESKKYQTDADMMPGYEICIGMPSQDCDGNEEECGDERSRIGRSSSGSSKSSTEESFELL